ncbi:MAG: hypothetical protein A3I61_16940 [Acidobacteria bacterium RIFCSPLOWO2_02_FULL_68_18]|nr:MAG: hypothetical protein A3I61_16940 [Acidobacteria bacterium RIFCSPLOWO2_02_FULL_68_18]OFW50141.1 MAG: hypothetical protein A3G77_09315 [Acidobacteria bacterium RIFCSPLOWO2_12_FULL_68_19]
MEITFALKLLHEPERAHHGDVCRSCELGGVAVSSSGCGEQRVGHLRCQKYFEHPLVQVGKEVGLLLRRMRLKCM